MTGSEGVSMSGYIAVINAGSSSVKFALYDAAAEVSIAVPRYRLKASASHRPLGSGMRMASSSRSALGLQINATTMRQLASC